jgi:hypothetical protein
MSEFEKFEESIADKSVATQKAYKVQYNKLYKLLGKNIADTSQKKIIEAVNTQDKTNSKQALLNIAILIRRLFKFDVKDLENEREKNKVGIIKEVKEKNTELKLPSITEIEDFTDYLYDNKKWKDYIINYLLINLQVRNKDLVFEIVDKKKDIPKYVAEGPHKNYMWLDKTKAVYVRRDYKTGKTYGEKINIITDPKFLNALKNLTEPLIPNPEHVGYYVQKATYKGVGEGIYFKILVDEYRDDLQKLGSMGESRGTKLETIATNYDIKN